MSSIALDSSVLVLNRYFMAVRVINVRRAFRLLCRSVAEVVHFEDDSNFSTHTFESWRDLSLLKAEMEDDVIDKDEWIRTVHCDLMVPRIVRLLIYDKLPPRDVKLNRRNIFARDSNRCQYCGKRFSTSDLSLDHVVPRAHGGRSSWTNLVCACLKCNVKKGGRTPRQAHMKLITEPVKPRRSPAVTLHLSHDKYRTWKQFLDNAYWSVELKD
ncbi:MAG: HNH endonuclease [Planctomycetota bacterium]